MSRVLLASLAVALLALAAGCGGPTDAIPTGTVTPPKGAPSMTGSGPKPVEFKPPK